MLSRVPICCLNKEDKTRGLSIVLPCLPCLPPFTRSGTAESESELATAGRESLSSCALRRENFAACEAGNIDKTTEEAKENNQSFVARSPFLSSLSSCPVSRYLLSSSLFLQLLKGTFQALVCQERTTASFSLPLFRSSTETNLPSLFGLSSVSSLSVFLSFFLVAEPFCKEVARDG